MSLESTIQKAAARENGKDQRIKLFRNNIGVAHYVKNGKEYTVPYGVGGEGAADELGFVVEEVTEEWFQKHKGQKVAIFLSVEWKRDGKDNTKPKRKELQRLWREGINRMGGRAGIARSAEDVRRIAGVE
jgi:hypothetical protein